MLDTTPTSLTLHDLAQLVDAAELKYALDEKSESIRLGFGMDHYRDQDGDAHVAIRLSLDDNGTFLSIDAPWLYHLSQAAHRTSFIKALAEVNYSIKLVQFGYDPGDQEEVRACMQLYLVDVKPSPEFIKFYAVELARKVDYCHRLLGPVFAEGKPALKALRARRMRPIEAPPSDKPDQSDDDCRSGEAA
ncbi:MAG: hypothetical protein O2855_08940 [Planctomycetota bacterium]|nr:hypothetical protein [Planctomycetota bacterium]